MTHQKVYKQLELVDQQTWLQTKELLSEESAQNRINYIKRIAIFNPKPIDYFITAVIEDDYCGRQQTRQTVGWGVLTEKTSVFRQGHRNDHIAFIKNLPAQFIQYLPTNIVSRLRKIAREEELKDSTKSVQLNEFSYQMFKAQLQAKKKLSGTEAIAQIKKLPTPTNKSEKEFYDKFLTLFWDNLPKKSIDFCEHVIGKSKNTIYSPIKIIKSDSYLLDTLKETEFSQAEIHIYLYDYQQIARQYNIQVLREFWTDTYSIHHNWVSGIPKATKLNQHQLEMTISQILVLDYIIKNVQTNPDCPYFTKLKNHLVEEITKPEYDIKPYLKQLHKSAQSTSATLQSLI